MDKKLKIIGSIVLSLVVIIAIIAFVYPSTGIEGLEGTLGKVDKYRGQQSGDEAIVLRTEFLKDTVVVGKTIRDLAQFSVFAYQLDKTITEWWIPQLKKYYSTEINPQVIKNLEDYTTFLRNSNETLNKTIIVLADLYYKKDDKPTSDIENQLINFVNYVKIMLVKDSILLQTISDIDKFIADKESSKTNKEQINNLKQIRDRIVMDNLVVACALGDEKMLKVTCQTDFYNVQTLVNCCAQSKNIVVFDKPLVAQYFDAVYANNTISANGPIFDPKAVPVQTQVARFVDVVESAGGIKAYFGPVATTNRMATAGINSYSAPVGNAAQMATGGINFYSAPVGNAAQMANYYGVVVELTNCRPGSLDNIFNGSTSAINFNVAANAITGQSGLNLVKNLPSVCMTCFYNTQSLVGGMVYLNTL